MIYAENNVRDELDRINREGGLINETFGETTHAGTDLGAFDVLTSVDLEEADVTRAADANALYGLSLDIGDADALRDSLTGNADDFLVVDLGRELGRGEDAGDALDDALSAGTVNAGDVHRLSDMGIDDFSSAGSTSVIVDARTEAEKQVDSELADYQGYTDPMFGGLLRRRYSGVGELMAAAEPVQGDGTWEFPAPGDGGGVGGHMLGAACGGKYEYDENTHLLTLRADRSLLRTMDEFKTSDRNDVAWDVPNDVPSINEYGEWQIRVDDPSTIQWNEDGSVTIPDFTQGAAEVAYNKETGALTSTDLDMTLADKLEAFGADDVAAKVRAVDETIAEHGLSTESLKAFGEAYGALAGFMSEQNGGIDASSDVVTSTDALDSASDKVNDVGDATGDVIDFVSDKFGADSLDGLAVASVPEAMKGAVSAAKESSGLEL